MRRDAARQPPGSPCSRRPHGRAPRPGGSERAPRHRFQCRAPPRGDEGKRELFRRPGKAFGGLKVRRVREAVRVSVGLNLLDQISIFPDGV